MMRKINNTNEQGFSLVETLVAISILLIVIVGPMTISTATARSSSFSSEQVTAFFLAQEGAELAQKARDQLLLDYFASSATTPNPWAKFTDSSEPGPYRPCFTSAGCGLVLSSSGELSAPVDCTAGSGVPPCTLHFNANGGRLHYTYTIGTNTKTIYTRKIRFTNVTPDDVQVISEVTWRTGNFRTLQSVKVETHLFNVYGTP